jgi:pimeloyl-ACP methyl ester carboxylesterase
VLNSQILHSLSHGDVRVKPDVSGAEGRRILFADGSAEEIDLLIFATGYERKIPVLPRELLAEGDTGPLFLNVFHKRHPGLMVVGFFETDAGCYPLIDLQSELVAKVLKKKRESPERLEAVHAQDAGTAAGLQWGSALPAGRADVQLRPLASLCEVLDGGDRGAARLAGAGASSLSHTILSSQKGRESGVAEGGVEPTFARVGSLELHFVEAGTGRSSCCCTAFPSTGTRGAIRSRRSRRRASTWSRPTCAATTSRTSRAASGAIASRSWPRTWSRWSGISASAQAHVVGHDWGGLVAWWTALLHPDVVSRLAILNAPHPAIAWRGLFRAGQLRRSRYVFWFQLAGLAERRFAADDFAVLRRRLRRDPVNASAFTDEDIDRYVEAMRQPGALTAAMNYYRAMFRGALRLSFKSRRRIGAPTLLIWGERDRYLGTHLLEGTHAWVPNLRIERIPTPATGSSRMRRRA